MKIEALISVVIAFQRALTTGHKDDRMDLYNSQLSTELSLMSGERHRICPHK